MKIILLIMIGLSLLQADYIRDDTKNIVLNTTTNLIWQDDADANTITNNWIDAINYCEALALGGFSDWRLPNYNELYLLADKSIYNPAISSVFQNITSSFYWSSTTRVTNISNAWIIYFYYGRGNADDKAINYYVRCVR
ncbi:MAG: DUF1566 domain-containing protein [Sulfurimonas sp.]|nr:DUF1566 domain-containing protein [Sulfurimonas sp.]